MADAALFRRLALAMPGATEAPHFDRPSFRTRVIFATLSPDGKTATLNFSPEEQEFRCTLNPQAFAPTNDAWGRRGWTRTTLAPLGEDELRAALHAAWQRASTPPPKRRRLP